MSLGKVFYDFTGKRVLITGAGGSLGQALASGFANAGASLVLHTRKIDERFEQLCDQLPGHHVPVQADLSREDEIKTLFALIKNKFSTLDVLVNNAAMQPTASLKDIDGDGWDEMMKVNMKAPHLCVRHFAKMFGASSGSDAAVVNIASIEADSPALMHSHYGASKGGLLQYTRAAALELGPLGIRLNAVSPGLIYRDGLEQAWPEGVKRFLAASPQSRLVDANDVVQAVLFLASEASRGITGINLRVDNGVGVTPGY